MLRSTMLAVASLALAMSTSTSVLATGGVYVDDLVLMNNGSVVFSENFDSGSLSGWTSPVNASLTSERAYSGGYSLYENCHGRGYSSTISSSVSVLSPGLLQFGFKVWLPAASEQWNNGGGAHVTGLYIILHSNTTGKDYSSGFWLYPYDAKYRMYLNGQYGSPVCSSGVWHNVMLTLDPYYSGCTPGQGRSSLNGADMLSAGYTLADFPFIDSITVYSNFGDNGVTPEPTSLLALSTGLAVCGAKLCRRRR